VPDHVHLLRLGLSCPHCVHSCQRYEHEHPLSPYLQQLIAFSDVNVQHIEVAKLMKGKPLVRIVLFLGGPGASDGCPTYLLHAASRATTARLSCMLVSVT
jgi:hypothetical protein